MDKNEIYKIIGYKGEYNINVKKRIRKLLKENHPDNHGNRKKFELINEVKKELEENKSSFKTNIKDVKNNNNDLDYDYFYHTINEIKRKKNELGNLLNEKKNRIVQLQKEYKSLYQGSLSLENNLLLATPCVNDIKKIEIIIIAVVIIMFITLLFFLLKNNNLFLIIFILLTIIGILIIKKYIVLMQKMAEGNKKYFTNYVKINNQIRENINEQNTIKKEIRELKRQITNMENDIRFYRNMLKK